MDKILPRLCIGINGKTGQYITAIDNGLIMNEEHMGGRGIRKGKRTDEPVKLATERKIKHMFNKSSIIMKQFKNLILAGALVLGLAGFAVSCDKYGDDIDELRDKVNTLASKDELSSQIASLQSALSAASAEASQASAEAATAKAAADKAAADAKSAGDAAAAAAAEANAAKAAADKAAADAKQAAIEALQSELETLKADLKEATDAQLAEFEKKVNAATEKVETLIGKVAGLVTSVELVYSYSKQEDPHAPKALTFTYADEQANVFGKDVTNNPLTFEKGNQYFVPAEVLTVRVSPTNAVLTPDMITLVNSKGESLDCIEVLKVEKYNDLLTTKAAGESGLWNVTVSLTNYDKKAFDAATKVKDENVLFAVKVNNTAGTEGLENRDVVSTYDITVAAEEYKPASDLDYYVDKTSIAEINNRYAPTYIDGSMKTQQNKSLQQEVASGVLAPEYRWKNKTAVVPIPPKAANSNVVEDTNDNRSDKDVYPAVQGTPITISLHDENGPYTNIRAFYVVLDEQNAVESKPSELNAWKSYTYDGLGVVVEGTETTITIDSETAINDIIGFRVYAVNYDGTLVDPDGKAFYVQLGTESVTWDAVATTIVPDGDDKAAVMRTKSAPASVTTTKLPGADHFEWKTEEIDVYGTKRQPAFYLEFSNEADKKFNSGNGSASDFIDNVFTKVVTTPAFNDWALYEDDKAYTGTLTVYNESNHVLATIKVTFTKKLPTAAPAGFSEKTGQLTAENIWNAYLIPIETSGKDPDKNPQWTNEQATLGAMNMDNVFNFGEHPENYVFTFAGTDDADKTKAKKVEGDKALEVIVDYIDNTTKHATTVSYNYGDISSDNKKNPYKVTVRTFQTVYNEIYNDTYTWAWTTGETPSVTYGAGSGEENADPKFEIVLANDITGTSSYDKIYNATLGKSYGGSVEVVSAKLTSNANGEEEYFEIDFKSDPTKFIFKPISEATRPEADVPSTLTVKYTDQYAEDDEDEAHTHEFTLDVIVKKRID